VQQLQTDLANNTVARYNWITPDQYNDMHTSLTSGFTYHGIHDTGDSANIAQGDNFLSIVVPEIEASAAFQNNGLIVLWWDESEGGDTSDYRIGEIIISPTLRATLTPTTFCTRTPPISSPCRRSSESGPCILDACNATDLSDLFKPGSIPTPEPTTLSTLALGLSALASGRFHSRRKRS
jgi:hypothetical protein